ncbi:APC family permease [Lysobacter sp. A3-1-A15]|uniref:APC family permease n=1 Tax=Novilysobacter viscosus TaxID=3098602 RepID=UPI002ED9CDE6
MPLPPAPPSHPPGTDPATGLVRAVGRWQIVGLSINDVVGSGIYLLPAAAALLLGGASLWAILAAGLAVTLLVLCYAQASSHFEGPGGAYLYAREAFGPFAGFLTGWMTLITRVTVAAALSNGLALAVSLFWPWASTVPGRTAIVVASLGLLTWINLVGVRTAARAGVALTIAKLLPLLFFVVVGLAYMDWSAVRLEALPLDQPAQLGEAALLLLFAYAGFENTPAAAGEYRNPRRDVPFALVAMIALVTALYVLVQMVAQGTLPALAQSETPLAEAAAGFAGRGAALLLTVGAAISILGTNFNTMLFGPRYMYALALDGYLPRPLARLHPRWRTPVVAIIVQAGLAVALALTGSFVELALLSVIARLFAYVATACAAIVLQRRHPHREGALRLPGGPLIPVAAIVLSLALLASASLANLAMGAAAIALGAVVYAFRRPPLPGGSAP